MAKHADVSGDSKPAKRETKPAMKPGSASPAGGRTRLGRGLSSLMQVNPQAGTLAAATGGTELAGVEARSDMREIDVSLIDPNPHQPRKQIGPAALSELAASIKSTGLIQPLVVRAKAGGRYELIAGERRLRASKIAELQTIPCIIREANEILQAQMALIENIQREDLNPMDRAEAYHALQRMLGMSQAELAERLGEERSSVANYIRLLELSEPVRQLVRDNALPLGHAKVLASMPDQAEQLRLAELCRSQNLTVRNLERLIAGEIAPPSNQKEKPEADSRARYLDQLAETLSRQVGTKCSVTPSGRNGYRLTLHLKNAEQFDRLMERLNVDLD